MDLKVKPLANTQPEPTANWNYPGRAMDAISNKAGEMYSQYVPTGAQKILSAITGKVGEYATAVDKFADNPFNTLTPEQEARTSQIRHQPVITGIAPTPGRFKGGLKYGSNATRYMTNQTKNYAAKEGQNFIKSQVENIVRNPTKAATPAYPFSFTTQATAQPSAAAAFTKLSKAEAGSFMGGLKPGSVEPVIPWTTKARVAGIDARQAVVGAVKGAGKAVGSGVKRAGVPLRSATNYVGTSDMIPAVGLVAGLAGMGYLASQAGGKDKQSKPVEQRTPQKGKPSDKNPKFTPSPTPNGPRQKTNPSVKPEGKVVTPKPQPGPVVLPDVNVVAKKPVKPTVTVKNTVVDKAIKKVSGSKPIPEVVAERKPMTQIGSIKAKPLATPIVPTKVLDRMKPVAKVPLSRREARQERRALRKGAGNFYEGTITMEPNDIPGILNRKPQLQR